MKLHLPKLLRKAVIACMTVVTGFSTTVATGAFAGGVAFFAIATQQAQAAGAISADGKVYTYSGTDNPNIDLSTLNGTYADLEKVIFEMGTNGNANWLGTSTGFTGLIQIGPDVLNESLGLMLNNGGGQTYEISNTIIGTGTIKKTGNGDNMILLFSGDTTGYNGKIELAAARTFTLQLGKAGVTAAETSASKGIIGTKDISFTSDVNNLHFAYDAGTAPIYVTNKISRTGSNHSRVNITGGADYIFTKNSTITDLTVDGGSIKFTSTWSTVNNVTLKGNVGLGATVANNGADRTVFQNLTSTGQLTISGQVVLSGAISLAQTAVNNGTVYLNLNDGVSIDLSNLTAETSGAGKGATGTYALFTGGNVVGVSGLNEDTGGWLTEVNLSDCSSDDIAAMLTGVETSGKDWAFADGKLTYTILATDLVWSSAGSLNWAVGTEFDGGLAFANDDNVIFEAGLGDVVATIAEDIVVSQLTVKGGTDLVLSGTGAIDITKAVFEEGSGLTIDAGQVMTWAPTTMEGTPTLTVKGELTVENGSFNASDILVDGGTLKAKAGYTVYLAGDVTIDNGGTIEVMEGDDLFHWNDTNNINILNGSTLQLNATRNSMQESDVINLNNGSILGTGALHNGLTVALDFFQNGTITAANGSLIDAPVRIDKAANTLTINVTADAADAAGLLLSGDIVGAGSLNKTGEGTLSVSGGLKHQGTTTISAGKLEFAGSSSVNTVIMAGGSMGVASTGSASIAALSGAGSISVAEGGTLTLTTVTVDGTDAMTLTGTATAGDGFAKKGTGSLTLAALNVNGTFNMYGHEGTLNIGSIAFGEGATLVYGKGDIISIAAPDSAVTMNVFGVADELSTGINTGIIYTDGMDLAALKELITVEDVQDFTLTEKEGYVYLSSTATLESDWDINWGATLADAPAQVTAGGIGTLASGTEGSLKLYDLYGNATYTPTVGTVAISLTGDGDANAVIIGGNDAHTDSSVGTVKTNVWIEATEGTYKAIVGGNFANNWGNGARADFEGDTHIKIDGATVGTVMGGNYKDGQGATFTGNSYISVFSGSVTGAIVGAGVTAHNNSPKFIGDTNIFVYTALEAGSSKLHSEPADMVIGGFAWGTNVAGTYTLDGNTNITIDLKEYTGEATFNKHIVGGNYSGTGNLKNVLTGSSNIVMDLGSASMGSGIKVIGGSWVDAGNTDIAATNVSIKSGTFAAPIVGGSWIAMHDANHKLGTSTINISGGTVKGNVFGANRLGGGSSTLIVGDVNILVNGEAAVSADIFGGNCIETQDQSGVTVSIDSVTITVEDDATVTGDIIGGNYCDRNNNSNSTSIKTGEITINLTEGAVKGNVYAGGYASGTAVQTVNDATVNISSTVELAAGKTISGGFTGDNAAAGVISNLTTLGLADTVEYTNLAGVNFVDFNAVSLGEGTKVTFANFGALNKELTVSGKGSMTVANASLAVDTLTLSGATLKADFGVNPTTALSLKITEPSQLISRAGKDLTLAALDIDMTGADAATPYVDIDGELKSISKVNINLTGIASLEMGTEYVLVQAGEMGLTAADLNVTMDATAPEGAEYVVEIAGTNIIFRAAYLSDWVWEGNTEGEGTVWSDNADGWKADGDSLSPNGKDLYFTSAAEGTVTVRGDLTPANINVSSGEYTFVADATNGGSIALGTDGVLSISNGATLNMAMDNADLGGTTDLKGTLVLQSADALGDTAIKFHGGKLVYDTLVDDKGTADDTEDDVKTHITTDLSKQASLAENYTGQVKIEVTDAENHVTWGTTDTTPANNSGVNAILTSGIEKTGAGQLTVQWQNPANSTYPGAITVKEGRLDIYSTVGTKGWTFSGAMAVDGYLNLRFGSCFNGNDVVLSGAMSGSGTIEIGSTSLPGGDGGRVAISANNSAFAGTMMLSGPADKAGSSGNAVRVDNGNALGGSAATLVHNGRQVWYNITDATTVFSMQSIVVNDGTVNYFNGSSNKTYNYTGTLTGSGQLIGYDKVAMTQQYSGDISGFTGQITAGTSNIWLLGGEGVANAGGDIQAQINGKAGTAKFMYAEDVRLVTGTAGEVMLQQSGAGTLILAAENTSTGKLTVDADSVVQLGADDVAGSWAGSELAGEGTMTLVNGALTGLTTKADTATLAVETTTAATTTFAGGAATGTVVDLTGSDATLVDSIKLVEGSTLIVDDALTVGGEGATTLDMSFTTDNIGATADGLTAMIQGGDLTIAGTEGVNLNMNNADVLTALNNIGEGDLYLQITDGKLGTADGVDINDVIAPDLLGLGVRAQLTEEGKEGGYVLINGDVSGVYFTDNQEGSSADTADTVTIDDSTLEIFAAVVINKGDTLEIAADTTINNLNGQEGGDLLVKNGADVVLNNEQMDTGVDGYDPMGANNELAGNLTGEDGSTITMQGEGGSLTVGGDVDVDSFTVQEGALDVEGSLSANDFTLQSGSLTVGESLTADELNIEGGSVVANGASDVATLTIAEGAAMEVGAGETLDLGDGTIDGELSGSSSELSTSGLVTVGENGSISGFDLSMADGSELAVGGMVDVSSLTAGAGATLSGTGGTVDVAESGSFAGTLSGSGALTTAAGSSFTFDNATGAAGWDVTNKGDMTIDLTESGNLTLGALTLADGSSTNVLFNSDNGTDGLLTLSGLNVADGAEITLSSTGAGQLATGEYTLGTVDGEYTGADELYVNFSGTAFSQLDKLNSYVYVDDNGNIVLNAVKSENNTLADVATENNAEVGAELLWNATAPVGGELEAAYNAVNEMIASGATQEANELMASVAGASNAALGMAFAGDVSRQLRAIRNRTTTMGVNQCVVNEGMPYVNAWVNVEGDRNELDSDSLASGYALDSWGGTVGVDVDVNPHLTLGVALTAMYGNLTTDGPDMAEGDMNTYYVSGFARVSSGAWTHTFVATIGRMDGSIERTVNYGTGAYTTEASVDGTGFGLMYEVGRVYALDEDGDTCLQPLFNIAYRHAAIGAFEEKNSDAALSVESQSVDTVTLGLGARLQSVVGENMFNRTSILELRAMAKLDVGDTTSETEVALINGTGRGRIESVELGAFGAEIGAGLHIPVGDENDGTIFMDFSAEFRSGYTNLNGVLGYRINF